MIATASHWKKKSTFSSDRNLSDRDLSDRDLCDRDLSDRDLSGRNTAQKLLSFVQNLPQVEQNEDLLVEQKTWRQNFFAWILETFLFSKVFLLAFWPKPWPLET
jgi:hypothetical protein